MPKDSYVFPLSGQCWSSQLGLMHLLAIAKMLLPWHCHCNNIQMPLQLPRYLCNCPDTNAIAQMPWQCQCNCQNDHYSWLATSATFPFPLPLPRCPKFENLLAMAIISPAHGCQARLCHQRKWWLGVTEERDNARFASASTKSLPDWHEQDHLLRILEGDSKGPSRPLDRQQAICGCGICLISLVTG